jgi:hypothetical protein
MLPALNAASVRAPEIHNPAPRRTSHISRTTAARHKISPDKAATAASPPERCAAEKTTSESHSHASQGAPDFEYENGSVAGTDPADRIRSPVRMCQPVSPSASNASNPPGRQKRATKMPQKKKSASEGSNCVPLTVARFGGDVDMPCVPYRPPLAQREG